jgi:ribosomal biogenesis protein LAS1
MYASAILRTINGYSDSMQQSRANVMSVASSCAQLGIPAWLVNIRHEATHNQLPYLPVLKIAARALLQYNASVFWEPIANHRWNAYAQAMESLQQYDTFAKQLEAWNAARKKPMDGDYDNDNDDDDDDECIPEHEKVVDDQDGTSCEEDIPVDRNELKKNAMPDPRMPVKSVLGTNFNSFAALLDEKPKKKSKHTATTTVSTTTATSSSKNNRQSQKNTKITKVNVTVQKQQSSEIASEAASEALIASSPVGSPYQIALQFIKLQIPIHIAYDALLDFLLGTVPQSGREGVFWSTEVSFETLCHLYRPLLTATCRSWPGFIRRLVNTLVHRLVVFENNEDEEAKEDYKDGMAIHPNRSKIQAADSWIRYLLSSKFLSGVDPHVRDTVRLLSNIHRNDDMKNSDDKSNKTNHPLSAVSSLSPDMATMAPLQVLQYLKFSLNGLCDQYCGLSKEKHPTSVAMVELWTKILGNERTPHFGLDLSILTQKSYGYTSSHQDLSTKERNPKRSATPKRPLTLEEMEAFLSDDDDDDDDEYEDGDTMATIATSPPRTIVWQRCTSWEPCALGTLPGCAE